MKNKAKNTFIWTSLRIAFWIMVAIWIFFMYFPEDSILSDTLSIIWLIATIFTFVVSIIHLTKYKEKAFAITALVISSIMFLLFFIGFISILISPTYGDEIILYDDIGLNLSGDLIRAGSFTMYESGFVNMEFNSDDFVYLYLFEEDEFERYYAEETSYYVQASQEVKISKWNEIFLAPGEYRFVIDPAGNNITYSFKLVAIPYY